MDINKKLPVWALIALDLLLVAAIILPFAYFHHVRDMWGLSGSEQGLRGYEQTETIAPVSGSIFLSPDPTPSGNGDTQSQTPSAPPVSALSPVTLSGDGEVRDYAEEAKLPLPALPTENASYRMLYRSADVYAVMYEAREAPDGYLAKYYVFDFYVKSVKNLYTVSGAQKSLHELIEEGEAYAGGTLVAAVNGDYSSNKSHCRVVVRNGVLYRSPEVIDSDVCVIYGDGTLETYTPGEFDFAAVEARSPYQIWDFGPELLDKSGKAKTEFDDEAYDRHILKNTHPRTAIGYYEPGHYCFVVVDGRQNDTDGEYIYGCSIKSLSAFFERIGCKRAYNMDGGASTQAYMNGVDVRVDSGRETQRVLSDIICIGEYAAPADLTGKNDESEGGN